VDLERYERDPRRQSLETGDALAELAATAQQLAGIRDEDRPSIAGSYNLKV